MKNDYGTSPCEHKKQWNDIFRLPLPPTHPLPINVVEKKRKKKSEKKKIGNGGCESTGEKFFMTTVSPPTTLPPGFLKSSLLGPLFPFERGGIGNQMNEEFLSGYL